MTRDEVIAMLSAAVPRLTEAAGGVAVHSSGQWISFETALHGDAGLDSLGVLRMQSALPGNIKVVRRPGHQAVRAEIPILVETAAARDWLRRQTASACAGLCAALQREDSAHHEADDGAFDALTIAERCSAGGWLASVAHDAEVRVELASRSVHRVATISPHGAAIRVAIALEAGALAVQGPDSQSAVAAFLLRATRSLRWLRAFGAAAGEALEAVGFECLLAPASDDRPIAMALDAIATACELYGCEAEALADSAPLAQQYIAWQRDVFTAMPNDPVERVPPRAVPMPGAAEVAVA